MNSGNDTGQNGGKDIPPWLQPVSGEEEGAQVTSKKMLGLTILGALVVIALFVTVILILYDGVSNEQPIFVAAPKTAMKEKPADPGGMKIVDQDKSIFDQGDGVKPRSEVTLGEQPELPLTEIPDDPDDKKNDPVGDAIENLTDSSAQEPTVAGAEETLASAGEPVAVPTAASTVQASKAYRVQLGAYSSETAAERTWRLVRGQFSEQMEGKSAEYEDVQSGDRTLFRLRVGPFADRVAADQVCLALRAREQACIVVNP